MAFTAKDVTEKVRRIIGDAMEPYRWEDDELRDNLQSAIKRLNARVPSTRYVKGELVDCVKLPEDEAASVAVSDFYEEALVYYVVYLCYSKDDPDTTNAELSNTYLAKAERLMA